MNTKMMKTLITGIAISMASWAQAAEVTVTGLGSNIIINKVGGFDGVDGVAREAAFVAAAQVWADILVSPVDIVVDAEFTTLYCVTNSATLGSAGPLNAYFGNGAEIFGLQSNVWYPTALINAHYGSDYFAANADISARFNANIGNADCLASGGWYYGMDGNAPSGYIDFYEVVLHELGHGLGILSLINSDGTNSGGYVDIFTTFLHDQSTAKDWTAMINTERNVSVVNTGNVVWSGAGVTALAGNLSAGVNAGKVQMYAPSPYESGSSISHFDTALSPNELMEPQYTGGASYDHSIALLKDIGWTIYESGTVAPVITGQSTLSTNEDTNLTISLNDLTVTDSDSSYPADFSLTVYAGSNYSVSGSTVIPNANYNGTLTVPVQVNDGTNNSNTYNLSVTVTSVNDVPTITGQGTVSINEDSSLTITTSDLTITDPDDNSFTLTVGSGSNYSVSGNQVTPSANYNGSLTVPVTVNDGEDDSASYNLSITVNAQNDKPVISATPTFTIDEDTNQLFALSDFTVSDVETISSALTLEIMSGTNYTVSNNTVTPTAEFSGALSVNARVFDGDDYSDTATFTLTVTTINDTPVLSGTPVTSIVEGESYSVQFSTSDPDGPVALYTLTTNHDAWLRLSDTGLLTGTASSALGTESVTVTVSDGNTTDSITFNLNVIGSSFADVGVSLEADSHLLAIGTSTDITMTISNNGPAANASGTATISHAANATITNLGSNCSIASGTEVQCTYTNVASSDVFTFSLLYDVPTTTTLQASLSPTQTDAYLDDNIADTTVFFSSNIAEPSQPLNFSATENTRAAAVGNLDNTGAVELVLANDLSTNEQQASFNSGFTAISITSNIFAINDDAYDVVIDDFNNDGESDVVFANAGSNSVYLANGAGGFNGPSSIGSADSYALASADLDKDGFKDLIFANSGSNEIYLNNGSGQFIDAPQLLGTATSTDVAVLDSNGDTWPDIIFINSDDDDLIYLNNGDGTFNTSAILVDAFLTNSQSVVVTDLDDDGMENDIIIGRYTSVDAPSIEVYKVVSNVLTSTLVFDGGDVISVSAGDYDSDGQVDIAAVNTDGVVQIYTQDAGAFSLSETFSAFDASQVLLAEIDADTKADLVVVHGASKASKVFLSDTPEEDITPVVIQVEIVPVTDTNTGNTDTGIRVTQSGSLSGWMFIIGLLFLFSRRRQPI